MSTPPVPPPYPVPQPHPVPTPDDVPPPGVGHEDASRTPAASSRSLGRAGVIAVLAAVTFAVTTVVATTFWLWNHHSAETWVAKASEAGTARDAAVGERDDLAAQVEGLEAEVAELRAAEQTIDDRGAELDEREAALDEREGGLDEREGGLDERETDVAGAEAAKAARTFSGDGTYRVGTDVEPGTYSSTSGGLCYWARLSGLSGEFSDIIANQAGEGAQVVTIAPGDVAFETSGCGEWTRE